MTLRVRLAVAADAEQIVKIRERAFANSIWAQIIFPGGQSEETLKMTRDRIVDDMRDQEHVAHMLVEDTATSQVVAASRWVKQLEERPENQWNIPMTPHDAGPGGNQAALDEFRSAIHEARLRNLKGRPHIMLDHLETLPEYQRQGAGSMLINWGTALADEVGLPIYLEATAEGEPLYRKFGFLDIGVIELDISRFGMQGKARNACLQRPPASNPAVIREGQA